MAQANALNSSTSIINFSGVSVGSSHTGSPTNCLISGGSNAVNGSLNLVSGDTHTAGTSSQSCGILSGHANTIANSATNSAVVSGQLSTAGGTGSTCLSGNSATSNGNYCIAGWLANYNTGSYTLALGRGTFSGSESVILTDQNSAYAPGALNQTFYARFTQGIDLNTVTISIAGLLTAPSLTVSGLSTFSGGQNVKITSVTAATYVVLITDYYLACNRAGAIAFTFPTATGSGRRLLIKDVSGAADVNNITATSAGATFDGVATLTVNTKYGFATLTDTAVNVWSIS